MLNVSVSLFLALFFVTAHACEISWQPGQINVIKPGRKVLILVSPDQIEDFKHQKKATKIAEAQAPHCWEDDSALDDIDGGGDNAYGVQKITEVGLQREPAKITTN